MLGPSKIGFRGMIKYALKCKDGHRFESWFQDSAAFDKLKTAGMLSCAVCGCDDVAKAIMSPRVVAKHAQAPQSDAPDHAPEAEVAPAAAPDVPDVTPSPDDVERMAKALRAFREHVETNTDDVGTDFASTARAMHEGEIDARPIRGQADVAETRDLIEDGIDIMPLPWGNRKAN